MNRITLEWFELLARALIWAAGIVLLLSIIGAVVIAGSDNALPLLEDVERQGRGIAALASLGGGLTSAGLLAGVGAILRLLVSDRLAQLGDEPEPEAAPSKPARERGRRGSAGTAKERRPSKGDASSTKGGQSKGRGRRKPRATDDAEPEAETEQRDAE